MKKLILILYFVATLIDGVAYGFSKNNFIVVPFGPGSSLDLMNRKLIENIKDNNSYFILNKFGADGKIAADYCLINSKSICIILAQYFSNNKEFVFNKFKIISDVYTTHLILTINKNLKINDFSSFLNYLKTKDQINAGVTGTLGDKINIKLQEYLKLNIQTIKYKNHNELAVALSKNEVDYILTDHNTSLNDNFIRLITSSKDNIYNNVPTFLNFKYNISDFGYLFYVIPKENQNNYEVFLKELKNENFIKFQNELGWFVLKEDAIHFLNSDKSNF